jgi:membrane fusion protein (multidrug efflux system)
MKISIVLLGFALLVLSIGCNHEKHEKEEGLKFLVTKPVRKDTMIFKEYVCQIKAISHIEMRSQERGYLQNIYVDEGQFVRKGQMMFQIMPVIYQAEKEKAKANVSFAEIEYQNTKNLADSNIVSKNELALSKAKLDKEKAELSLAQAHLSFTEIRAPFDGIMDRFYERQGSLVDEGELLTMLSDNSKMWVYFNVPEAEYLDYAMRSRKGGKQKVQLKGHPLATINILWSLRLKKGYGS